MALNLYTPNGVSNKFIVFSIAWLVTASVVLIIVCAEIFGDKSNFITPSNGATTSADSGTKTSITPFTDATTSTDSVTTTSITSSTVATTSSDSETTSSSTNTTWSSTTTKVVPGECEIIPTLLDSPLLIAPGTTYLIYPEPGFNTTKFSVNETVEFACPNTTLTIGQHNFGSIVTAICKDKEQFEINGTRFEWRNITCGNVKPNVTQLTALNLEKNDPVKSCFNRENNTVANIGFDLDGDRFLSLVKICFNTSSKIALYSYYNLTASINNRITNVTNLSFKQDDLFYKMGKSVSQMYSNNQTTINTILGLDENSTEYINESSFINRGHLAARADFVYSHLQRAVYRYINVAPQWSRFNGGNWNQLENDIRNYAATNKTDLQIWTGTYGISSLPNTNNSLQNLYLYVNDSDSKNSPSFPVPEVFWKLVYNPLNQQGVVFVGHNNPYMNVTDTFCEDVSGNVTWIRWNGNDTSKGFSYACDYNDNKFLSRVPYMPEIEVKKLLT